MRLIRDKGYFGIGIYNTKIGANVGTLWRSANIFGVSFIFTIGHRYKKQSSDTMKTPNDIPLLAFDNFDDFYKHLPYGCQLVGIEIVETAIKIQEFEHPKQCVYLLGAEDHGLPDSVLGKCQGVVVLPGDYCLNVATAGSIVLYDRILKE